MVSGGGWATFDTPLGRCAIAWSARGITRMQLPESNAEALRRRIGREEDALDPALAPEFVRRAIGLIGRLLGGERVELAHLPLDLEGIAEFQQRVYALTRAIPAGETRSYGDIARALGEPGAARAVGQALGANPLAVIVPCHRVLAADGSLHGFSARGGINTKQRLLEIERAQAAGSLPLF
jgi:methylated-DNA-[protein]-cysteine S-methyltransferase